MAARNPHFEPNLLPTRQFNPPIRRANFPSICMNKHGTVVVFYQSSSKIYYKVGTLKVEQQADQPPRYTCDWGEVQLHGPGCNVQAAINDEDQIVIVHGRRFIRRFVGQAGQVQPNDKTITWGEESFFRKGVNPTVALKGDLVILVHERNFGLYRSHYNLAKISGDNTIETKGASDRPLPSFDERKEISVSVNNTGSVVFSCRMFAGRGLFCAVGKLSEDESSIDHISQVERYTSGYYSHICLLDDGKVVEVHEKWTPKNACLYKFGYLRDDKTIVWDEDKEFDRGYNPCVAVSEAADKNYRVIIAHISKSYATPGELQYKFGSLIETD